MNLEIGDMAEVVDSVKGLDDQHRSYELKPGYIGLIVDEAGPSGFYGLLVSGEIIYVPGCCMQKLQGKQKWI